MAFRSNGGHIAGEEISAYVDEELSSPETARVFAHLQACDQCRSLADDLRATQTLVRELPLVRAPREFTLGPEFDVAPAGRQSSDAPKRGWFNFMPAVALSAAVLLLFVFVDLTSPNFGGAGDDSSGGSSSLSSSSRTVEDAAKAGAEAQAQPAQAPPPQPAVPRQGQPIPVPATGGGNTQGFGPTPAASSAGPPATGPGGTPVPLLVPAAPTAAPPGALIPPVAADNTAGRVPTPTNYTSIFDADESADEEDNGLTTLRILEIIATVVLLGAIAGLFWQRRLRA